MYMYMYVYIYIHMYTLSIRRARSRVEKGPSYIGVSLILPMPRDQCLRMHG